MSDSNIFIAAKRGDIGLLEDLIGAGHGVNHRDKLGKTALHHAVEGIWIINYDSSCLYVVSVMIAD